MLRFVLALVLSACVAASAHAGDALDAPPTPEAARAIERGLALFERGDPAGAVSAFRAAIAASPNHLRTHLLYRTVMRDFLDGSDEVDAEYAALVRDNPSNPVYLLAANFYATARYGPEHLERVVALAPDWAWAHYARARLLEEADPEAAAAEYERCIAKDPSAYEAYSALMYLYRRAGRTADALAVAERTAARPEFGPSRFVTLWRLRVADGSTASRDALRAELAARATAARDVETLLVVAGEYTVTLEDAPSAEAILQRVREIDPEWYPGRGVSVRVLAKSFSEVPREVAFPNRQGELYAEIEKIACDPAPADGVARLERMLASAAPTTRRYLYEQIVRVALRTGDAEAAARTAPLLLAIDPDDNGLRARVALLLARKRHRLDAAVEHALEAERRTAVFRPAARPVDTPRVLFDDLFPEKVQREVYTRQRALALHAAGLALAARSRAAEAEPRLREAVALEPTEARFDDLAATLRLLGRASEADRAEARARTLLVERVRSRFVDEPIEDFSVESIDGRRLKLSDLAGKVVVVNFWATWCLPCRREMPHLVRLYEQYRERGLEVVSISTDEEREKVEAFARTGRLPFAIFRAPEVAARLGVAVLPTSLFVDRKGAVRYRTTGFGEEDERELEAAIKALLGT